MARIIKAVLFGLLMLMAEAATAQAANWTVSESSGAVTIRAGDVSQPAKRGTIVHTGDILSTGPGSRAVVVRGNDFMTVNANSRVRLPIASNATESVFDVIQEWGNSIFKIEKKAVPHFRVRTPYLAAVVKGTTFSITVSSDGASLQVIEGAVETATFDGGASDLVRPGVVAMVSASDRFRLTIQGQDQRTIDSPSRDQNEVARTPKSEAAKAGNGSAETGLNSTTSHIEGNAFVSPAGQMDAGEKQFVNEVIAAPPVDVGSVTNGLVSGTAIAQVAGNDVAAISKNAHGNEHASGNGNSGGVGSGNSGGSGNGNSGSNGNSNSGSNGSGNSSSNGNSNSGSNDNGNSGSNGNSNSGSNGNGNSGSNGNSNSGSNGNGNSGSNGNSNSGSNGNGNSGSNGNSNSGSDDNGNSGSNGNSNSGGNGNGNSGSNVNSNSGGNGNGNSGSNGNSNSGGNGNGNSGSNGNGNSD
jgi:hypothetical protein